MKKAILILLLFLFGKPVFCQSADELLNLAIEKNKAKNYGDAIEYLTKAISLDDTNPDAWFLRGTLKMIIDDFQNAIPDLNKALEIKAAGKKENKIIRNNSCIYCHLAYTNAKLDNPIMSISFYDKAIEANPARGESFYRRGLVKLTTGQKEDAANDFKKAERLNYKQASEALKNYFQ